jgi:hypothetical protein
MKTKKELLEQLGKEEELTKWAVAAQRKARKERLRELQEQGLI